MINRARVGTRRSIVLLALSIGLNACAGDDDDAVDPTTSTSGITAVATEPSVPSSTAPATAATAAPRTEPTTSEPVVTSAAPEGVPFTSAEGDYTVVFPSEPAQQTQSNPLPEGGAIDILVTSVVQDGVFISTARGTYPDSYQLDAAMTLQAVQDQTVAALSGTLLETREVTVQGRPGREFSASITSNGVAGTLLERLYLDGLVIYQLIVSGPGELGFDDPELAPFFSSFAFTTG